MLSHVHMAKSLQFQLQRKMQTISNNIGNIQSPGYKVKVVRMESIMPWGDLIDVIGEYEQSDSFEDLYRKKQKYPEYGAGVRVAEVARKFTQGTLEVTNRDLDVAIIDGEGLMQFRMPDGTLGYSRGGNLVVDSDGYLTNQHGHPIEPAIRFPKGATNIMINEEGRVYIQLNNEPQQRELGQIMLATFRRPEELIDVSQNLYKETPASEEAYVKPPGEAGAGRIKQRVLELSNVNILDQMMEMLFTQRQFHLIAGAQEAVQNLLKSGADLKL
jgi:flagellar basal-body rod protein FlgG